MKGSKHKIVYSQIFKKQQIFKPSRFLPRSAKTLHRRETAVGLHKRNSNALQVVFEAGGEAFKDYFIIWMKLGVVHPDKTW